MEKAAHKLSEKIAVHLQYDEDRKAVIEYGLIALFNIVVIGLIISCIGIIFRFWYESAIIFLGVGILKKSTGGAHARTLPGCVIVSVLSITLFAAISRYVLDLPIGIYINSGITVLLFILCLVIFDKYVPVDTPNKPINKPEKIKRLRRQSFTLLSLYAALAIIAAILAPTWNRLFSITSCIRFVLLWQTFMLTRPGHRMIGLLTLNLK